MNKNDLVLKISEKAGVTKTAAEKMVNAFTDTVTEALKAGDKVQLVGFGTFETVEKAARTGRNPQTGKEIKIDAKTSPKFKAGASLKDAVAGK